MQKTKHRARGIERTTANAMNPYHALLIFTVLIWSQSFAAIEVALRYLSPVELVAARFLPVGVVCAVYAAARRRDTLALLRDAGWKITFMGLASVVGYNYLLNVGQTRIPSGAASILVATNPLQTYLLAAFFLKEPLTRARTAGLLTAFAGLYVVVAHGSSPHGGVDASYAGHALLILLAPLCWALYTLTGKTLLDRHRPLLVTYISLGIGSLPTAALMDGKFFAHLRAMPWEGWAAVLYLSVFCTLLGFFFWAVALRRLSATVTSSFVYLNPPLAVVSAAVFLGHPVRPPLILGLALVLGGIFLASRRVPAPTAGSP